MDIADLNPWWKSGKISQDYEKLKRRLLFTEVTNYLDDRQIIVISGLRRTGKTVLMHHLVDHLLKRNVKAENIMYFDFDLAVSEIDALLENYQKFTNVDYKKEKVFIFLDEVQKVDNWQNKIKIIYDTFMKIKFFVSGSSSMFIEKRTKESLGGRSFSFQLLPLTFIEYIQLKNKTELVKNPLLYEKEIRDELKNYAISGGFPELLHEGNTSKIQRYVKELIIDKVVYIDIPKSFKIEEPELLQTILSIISSSPGIMTDYDSLASDLKRNRKTISNYLLYLEKTFLIKKLYNFSKNLLTSEKRKKKFYPSTTALAHLYNADYGKMFETIFFQNTECKFFYRKNRKEVDFVLTNGKNHPYEVKTKKMDKQEKISLLYFMKKFKVNEGFVITDDYESKEQASWFGTKGEIAFVPMWKWLLTKRA